MSEVVRLGAWCDCRTVAEVRTELEEMGFAEGEVAESTERSRRQVSIDVAEFAVLADGRRVTLHEGERGYSGGSWRRLTMEGVRANALATVLPDDDASGDEHPWEWLAQLLNARGVEASADQLRAIPYVVEFSDRLRARIASAETGG